MRTIIFSMLSLLLVSSCQLFEQKKDATANQESALNTIQSPVTDTLASIAIVETPKSVTSTKTKESAKQAVKEAPKGTAKGTEKVTAKGVEKVTAKGVEKVTAKGVEKAKTTQTPQTTKESISNIPQPKATPKTTPKPASVPIITKEKAAVLAQKTPVEVTAKGQSEIPTSYSSAVSFNTQMLEAVNALRKSGVNCGNEMMPPVKPLTWNAKLEKASMIHVLDMDKNDRFSHVGTDGSLPEERIKATGYTWERIGENIGRGYINVPAAIKGWKESTNHCKQMMSPEVTQIGAAKMGNYWVQVFAKPL